jgi:shikimate dehydrogenase
MQVAMASAPEEVDYVSGRTRMFAIVGDPIAQVRSPELVSAEFRRRRADAIMVPLHVLPGDFDTVLPALMRMPNLGGLVFTIPFKVRACALADELTSRGRVVGAINAMVRGQDGRWRGDMLDGLGCVEGFRRRGLSFAGQRVCLIGAGGAGSAVGVAVASEGPRAIRLFDVDTAKAEALAAKLRATAPQAAVVVGPPTIEGIDILMNASPVGMLDDPRMPIAAEAFPASLVVFDAITKPERTKLLAVAETSGCRAVTGREMMRGQIAKMVDFFGFPA